MQREMEQASAHRSQVGAGSEGFESRARGLMLGLLLGDAAGEWSGETALRGTCLAQLACFTLEGLIRASVRDAHKGICDPASVVWHAWYRWGHLQGIGSAADSWGGGAREWPDGWLSQVTSMTERRGSAPATWSALSTSTGLPEPRRGVSEGHHGLTRQLPVAIFASLNAPEEVAGELASFTHGPRAAAVAARATALLGGVLRDGSQGWEHADDSDLDARALERGTAEHAFQVGLNAARGAADLYEAVAKAAPHGAGAVTFAGALHGAEVGIEGLPSDLLSRLRLGWIADQLARDAVREQTQHPGGAEYTPALDDIWLPKYPGW